MPGVSALEFSTESRPTPLGDLPAAYRSTQPSRPGHVNELTGRVHAPGEPQRSLSPLWQAFWQATPQASGAELDALVARVRRRVQDDGASYNVHGDPGSSRSRQWPLELLPMLISSQDWAGIEAGIRQRARMLNATLADVYGQRRLLHDGLLPTDLVLAHPSYLRPMHGCRPPGGVHLHVLAVDLARCEDGRWWVVGQRTQVPSGLGYILENRLVVAQQFPQAFREMGVQRLAASYRDLLAGLTRLSPAGARSRVALLTPGPRNETYFEHAFLARYLGIALVEGGDLTVREDKVYLKTLTGLERVHVLLRRVDDDFLDPLELRPDSQLGVPGLIQALRAGEVVVANAPGSGWLESPGLSAFWPGVAEALLGEPLSLPAVTTWWCGEAGVWASLRNRLREFIVVPSFPAAETTHSFDPVVGAELSPEKLAELARRIEAEPSAYTLQAPVKLSHQPVWTGRHLEPRAAVLRVYALSDGQGDWQVLPGGLTRVAPQREASTEGWLSIQRGSATVDTWVLTDGPVDTTSLLPAPMQPAELAAAHRTVTSRAAENLFWLGRYTERAENTARLARLTLEALAGVQRGVLPPEMTALLQVLARRHGLFKGEVPGRAEFEHKLLAALPAASGSFGVGFNLGALRDCGEALRERLSPEAWRLIHDVGQHFEQHVLEALRGPSAGPDCLGVLTRVDTHLAALTGIQTDRMTRDDGWRLLSIGRQIERLVFLCEALADVFEHDIALSEDGFALVLALFDSTITYRAQFQARRELAPLLHLLVHSTENPRSLGWVTRTLRERFAKLSRHEADPSWAAEIAARLPEPTDWPLEMLSEPETHHLALTTRLRITAAAAQGLSNHISQQFFAHVVGTEQRVWQ